MSKYHYDRDDDNWDEADEPQFQRVRKQTGKQQTVKDARKQEAKAFGREISKHHKQRRRIEGGGKP